MPPLLPWADERTAGAGSVGPRGDWSTEIHSIASPSDQQVTELRFLVIQQDFWFTQ